MLLSCKKDPKGLLLDNWFVLKRPQSYQNRRGTMLQKFSKCEVKAWLWWKIILLPLRFYVKSNFDEFKRCKNVIFGNFRDSKLEFLVIFGLESCSNLLKLEFRIPKLSKMTFLDHLNWPNDFTYNLTGAEIIFQQSQALTSHFENFWSIVWWTGIRISV